MLVYRYLSEEELKSILANDKSNIGREFFTTECKQFNSHKYKKGVKYLHFFKNKKDIKHIKPMKANSNKTYYICEFDIPFLKLLPHIGYGVYAGHGYDEYNKSVCEFIISVDKFDTKWLKNFEKDKEKTASLEK
ncbi:MAG: hypothetical protein E7359_01795 [Clostridiales bacterium]|nr:hypothetical protein [Clostridiales bacterium]